MEAESSMVRAIQAYDTKDYASARKIWEELSETNPDAMVNLGTMMVKGFGVQKNMQRAFELFERAAHSGHEIASFYLGGMYENGIGTECNRDASIRYYSMAAEAGMSQAQLKLGILLRHEEPRSAMHWMIRAAHGGESQAQSLLTYVSNQEMATDINVAFRRLDPSSQKGKVEEIIKTQIAPILSSDGGGVELIDYIEGETPQIWLRYLGACSGCHLGPTSTAGLILDQFESAIDQKIVIYLW